MKQLILALMAAVFILLSCEKPEIASSDLVDLRIVNTQTPPSVVKGNDITSTVTCEAPNLCYVFSRFDVTDAGNKQYDIHAKANYPNPLSGGIVCAQAIYRVDTILRIPATQPGTYVLRFYNEHSLFKRDTVVVNQ